MRLFSIFKNIISKLNLAFKYYRCQDIGITDANALTENGFYSGLNLTNAPSSSTYHNYAVIRTDNNANYITQVAFPQDQKHIYMRYKYAGTWTTWGIYSYRPSIYQASGYIMSGNGGIGGYGIAEVHILGDIARIDFSFSVQSAGSSGFAWGLNSILMHNINSGIPSSLTPLGSPCGTCTYYTPSGTVNTSLTGYGGTVNVVSGYSQLFGFGRIYNTSGDNGMWGENSIPTGTLIVGTCYGKI